MIIVRKKAPRTPRRVELYEGVAVIGPPLDAIQHKALYVAADQDLAALREGRETAKAWTFSDSEIAALEADEDLRASVRQWMRSVLLVEAFAKQVEGVQDEQGNPVAMDFDLALYLMCDARFEAKFRYLGGETERLYVAEKNASGPGPNGSGAAAPSIAADAGPSTQTAQEGAPSQVSTA